MTYHHPPAAAFPAAVRLLLPFLLALAGACRESDPADRLEEARRLQEAGDSAGAAAILEQLLPTSPGDYTLLYELARAQHRSGAHEAAIRTVGAAIAAQSESIDARLLRGTILADLGRGDEALPELRQLVATDPRRAGVHRVMGMVHARAGRVQMATNQFEKELAINPGDPFALAEVGVLYFNAGRLAEAEDRLRLAIQADPDAARPHRFLAEVLIRSSRHQDGLDAQRRAFALDPDDIELLLSHARALHNYGHPGESAQRLREALDRGVVDARIHMEIARQAGERLDYPAAIAALRQAVAVDPDLPDARLELGKLMLLQGQQDEALPVLEEVVRLAPMNPFAYFYIGSILEDREKRPEAMEMYQRTLKLDPQNPKAHYALARLLLREGRREEAEAAFARHAEIMGRRDQEKPGAGVATMD